MALILSCNANRTERTAKMRAKASYDVYGTRNAASYKQLCFHAVCRTFFNEDLVSIILYRVSQKICAPFA